MTNHRTETRKERYQKKFDTANQYPIELCTINFQVEENVAFVIRSAAAFGASTVNIIGTIPERKELMRRSGTTQDLVKLNQFPNVNKFLSYIKENNIHLISAEMCEEAISIHDYDFPKDKRICIVLGHETLGINTEILMNSDVVYIPMYGKAHNLNTSQCGTVFLYEITKRLNQ